MMLGIHFILCTFTTMYSTHVGLLKEHGTILMIIYQIMMVTGTLMAMYPIWPLSVKREIKEVIIGIWWPLAIFYMLIFFSCFFVMVSEFNMLQVAVFIINLMLAAMLLGWRSAIIIIPMGFYLGIKLYQYYFGEYDFNVSFGSPEFILVYVVMLIGTTIIIFFKPKQEYLEATEQKVGTLETEVIHYNQRINDQGKKFIVLEQQHRRF